MQITGFFLFYNMSLEGYSQNKGIPSLKDYLVALVITVISEKAEGIFAKQTTHV